MKNANIVTNDNFNELSKNDSFLSSVDIDGFKWGILNDTWYECLDLNRFCYTIVPFELGKVTKTKTDTFLIAILPFSEWQLKDRLEATLKYSATQIDEISKYVMQESAEIKSSGVCDDIVYNKSTTETEL